MAPKSKMWTMSKGKTKAGVLPPPPPSSSWYKGEVPDTPPPTPPKIPGVTVTLGKGWKVPIETQVAYVEAVEADRKKWAAWHAIEEPTGQDNRDLDDFLMAKAMTTQWTTQMEAESTVEG